MTTINHNTTPREHHDAVSLYTPRPFTSNLIKNKKNKKHIQSKTNKNNNPCMSINIPNVYKGQMRNLHLYITFVHRQKNKQKRNIPKYNIPTPSKKNIKSKLKDKYLLSPSRIESQNKIH